MTDKEYKRELEAIRQFNAELASDPKKARAHLMSIGIVDKDGNILPPYRIERTSRNGHKQAASHSRLSRVR
jgi:hypothetical protein